MMSKEFLKKLGIVGITFGLCASPLVLADSTVGEQDDETYPEETDPGTNGNVSSMTFDTIEYENEEEATTADEWEEENEEEETTADEWEEENEEEEWEEDSGTDTDTDQNL